MHDAALGGVHLCTAKILGRDLLVEHRLDNVGASQEHVARATHGENKVGESVYVSGRACACVENMTMQTAKPLTIVYYVFLLFSTRNSALIVERKRKKEEAGPMSRRWLRNPL